MIKVSYFSKMGDLMYALPAIKALARLHDEPIHLLLAGHAWQMVPLLWEQNYFEDVTLEMTATHQSEEIHRGRIANHWNWYKGDEGYNLSLQPRYFEDTAPISWTRCYMQVAGIDDLAESDLLALPSLINHRRWLYGMDVSINGIPQRPPKNIILAPETDTLEELPSDIWEDLAVEVLQAGYTPVVVGTRNTDTWDAPVLDLRGRTTVPTLAKLIAESAGFIGAHSFPWHLARHSETPAVCVQSWRKGLKRCIPIDTPYLWIEPTDVAQVWPQLQTAIKAHAEARAAA